MDSTLTAIYQEGEGGLPVFAGSYSQGGAGFLGNLFKIALPILKTAGKHAVNIASSTAHDVLDDKDTIGDALIKNSIKEVRQAFNPQKRSIPRKRPRPQFKDVHKQTSKRRHVN